MLSSFMFLVWSSVAMAEEPKFSIMAEGEPSPFEGVLFDPEATAIIMSGADLWRSECDLEIEFNLDKQGTQYSLQLDNAQIRYDALAKENQLLIEKKDLEIQTLQETLKKKSPFNKWVWFAAGGIAGTSATVIIAKQFIE